MATLKECIETLQASLGGGVYTSENLADPRFMETVLRTARAFCIKEMYPTKNNVHEIYYQNCYLTFDADLQEDDCYTLFRYPTTLNINSQVDGHAYLGQYKGDSNWVQVQSHAHWANFQKARGSRIIDNNIYYVFEPQDQLVKVFNTDVKTAVGYSIFENPLDDLLKFNPQLSEYPITLECLSLVEQYLREGKFQRFLQRPANMIANGADDVNLMAPQTS